MFEIYSHKKNKYFYSQLYRLAIPMALTALLSAALNMVDTVMISSLGKGAVSAVGASNQLFFLMIVSLYGVFSGFGVFISQYWGKKDMERLQTVYFTAILTGLVLSSIVMVIAFFAPSFVLNLFNLKQTTVAMGVPYLKIVSLSYIISSIVFSFEMVCRSTENVRLPLMISGIGVITNTTLNYVLIFGHYGYFARYGFHAMGVEGAAIATVISRVLQLILYLSYIFTTKNPVMFLKLRNLVPDFSMIKKAYAKSIPVMGNEFFWALGISAISAAYGKKSEDAFASMQLFATIVNLITVLTMGIANSSGIMIGKKIGEKEFDTAKWYTKLFLFNAIRFGIVTSVLLITVIPLVPYLYSNQEHSIIYNIQTCLAVNAFYMPFNFLAATFIVGILRSGGDTTAAFIFETTTLWGYAVPVAFFLVMFTPLSLPIIYMIITFELVIKDFFCYIRYQSGAYLHNLVH